MIDIYVNPRRFARAMKRLGRKIKCLFACHERLVVHEKRLDLIIGPAGEVASWGLARCKHCGANLGVYRLDCYQALYL